MNGGYIAMCEESLLGRGDGDSPAPAPLVKVDKNPRLSQGSKKKQMLEEVLRKIAALAPPIPPRDARFFYHVYGLTKEGRNPHSLSKLRDAPGGALEAILGAANTRHVFSVKNVTDKAVASLIHNLYPLCYSLSELPRNRPITKELCLGIYCQYVEKDLINWAQFAEETNVAQRKLHAINKGKLLALRDSFYRERGKVPPLEDSSVIHLGGAKSLGFILEVPYQRQSLGQMDSLGFRREDSEFLHKQPVGWLEEWVSRLATEVWELANLSNLEVTAAKCMIDQLAKEKRDLNDETRFLRMLCKSSRAEVL
jgi:hypothetical protein